jgi:sterol desaturase/sphingolipid hydroxylase (fatty acid hydroxylase superfamily)
VATALVFTVGVQLLLQHSNVDHAVGPLRHVLALNVVHRFHHYRWAGIGDVNFGLFTNLWDRLLGTSSWDPHKRFTSADLGIAKRPDFPARYWAQLAEPFRRTSGGSPGTDPGS